MRLFLVLVLNCCLSPLVAKADFLPERRVLWGFTNEEWDRYEAAALQPTSQTARLLALDEKSYEQYFAEMTSDGLDGEAAEHVHLTLFYLDCKLGRQGLIKQVDRQSQKVKSEVARILLRSLEYQQVKGKVPAYFLDYLERNQPPQAE